MVTLGLDIGTNSVGSAWVDTELKTVRTAVSVFPAGVDEAEDKRGAPKNQDRRSKRSQRRSFARRAGRKRALRRLLTEAGLFPKDATELDVLLASNPWELRRRALNEPITLYELGRILLHLAQRRGAAGLKLTNEEEGEESEAKNKKTRKSADQALGAEEDEKIKGAIKHAQLEMNVRRAETFGEMIAMVMQESRHPIESADVRSSSRRVQGNPREWRDPIRNKGGEFKYHADREMLRDEFKMIWDRQSRDGGALTDMEPDARDELRRQLDEEKEDATWRHKGILFGQRRTYWKLGTMGRCDLEPSDRCVPIADRWASHYRVLESLNNIRVRKPGEESERPLASEEREKLLHVLRKQKTASPATVRTALGMPSVGKKRTSEDIGVLNIERDRERELNTDWFYRAIVHSAIGEDLWNNWDEQRREGVNRAILRFEPGEEKDETKLRAGATQWWGLDEATTDALVVAWKTRPKTEKRLNMSRRAIQALLCYMTEAFVVSDRKSGAPTEWAWVKDARFDPAKHRWPTQLEARLMFAEDLTNGADEPRRERYRLGAARLNKAKRHYKEKHAGLLPPAPTLTNPVVRKAIHEVRRHVIAHIRESGGQIPDRIVIEFAREASKPAKVSDAIRYQNRLRESIRRKIETEVIQPAFKNDFYGLSHNQLRAAVERVLLCRRQNGQCAYSHPAKTITDFQAATGQDLEIDHIVPYSRCGDNSLNNRVLCYRAANRDKGRQTPREWWGDSFDTRSAPMRFMGEIKKENYKTWDGSGGYFSLRDYAQCWKRFDARDVPAEWRGSQLSDTAYAAKEVMAYLQNALWPGDATHLEGGERRILVTKGAYTRTLRKDWQLYQQILRYGEDGGAPTPERVREASAKNRGDHREHAVDAVAIALTDGKRIQSLAKYQREVEEARAQYKEEGRDADWPKRKPLNPSWGTVAEFRAQVLRQVYGEYDTLDSEEDSVGAQPIVVCHRPVGKKLTGRLHKETLYGPVLDSTGGLVATRVTKRQAVYDNPKDHLKPDHLREAISETPKQAIARLTKMYQAQGSTLPQARKLAKAKVESPEFKPCSVEPSLGKSGLVRDTNLRKILRACLRERGLDPDDFKSKDLKQSIEEYGPLRHASGVPIRHVVLLVPNTEPYIVPHSDPRKTRLYDSQNNHHMEIRENEAGRWRGLVVPMHEAVRRVRRDGFDAIDRSDNPEKGGRFVMSLSEGETVFMQLAEDMPPSYYVVFKLDKPQTIQFKQHWDARRAKGEKDPEGNMIPGSQREAFPVVASKFRDMAPPGEATPVKVEVDPLGRPRRVEPLKTQERSPVEIDPRVMAIARDAWAARKAHPDRRRSEDGKKRPGSWAAMRSRMEREGLAHLAPQLSEAMRQLKASEVQP